MGETGYKCVGGCVCGLYVVLCVRVSACHFSLVFCYHAHAYAEIEVHMGLTRHGKPFIIVFFAKNALFRRYGIICLLQRQPTSSWLQNTDINRIYAM